MAEAEAEESSAGTKCLLCGREYTRKVGLYRHQRKAHSLEPKIPGTLRCPESNCEEVFRHRNELRDHITHEHQIVVDKVFLEFASVDDFLDWKKGEEKVIRAAFILHRGPKNTKSIKTLERSSGYYYCHGSAKWKKSSSSEVSSNVDVCCPASINVQKKADGSVKVEYWNCHYGHGDNMVEDFLLTTEEQKIIKHDLKNGTLESVMDNVADNLHTKLNRFHLAMCQDFHKIIEAMDIPYTSQLNESNFNVHHLLQCNDESVMPVILYDHDDNRNLVTEQILKPPWQTLVFMTPVQVVLMKQFGTNIICIDCISGDEEGTQLLTVLVMDESGIPLPVAYCFSSNFDNVMEKIFVAIKKKVGKVQTKIFMSDDSPTTYNAWQTVMGPVQKTMICPWFTDKMWRKEIGERVLKRTDQVVVYRACRYLLEQMDKEKFEVWFTLVVEAFENNPNTVEFGRYFRSVYGADAERWSFCYQRHCGVNISSCADMMHKILQHFYVEGKQEHHIWIFLQLARVLIFNYTTKNCNNVKWIIVKAISDRHEKSMAIRQTAVKKGGCYSEWVVKDGQNQYIVRKLNHQCNMSCRITCLICDVCVHQYSCNCLDMLVHYTICKHIHCVKRPECDDSYHNNELLLQTLVSPAKNSTVVSEKTDSVDTVTTPEEEKKSSIKQYMEELQNMLDDDGQMALDVLDDMRRYLVECKFMLLSERKRNAPAIVGSLPKKKLKLQKLPASTIDLSETENRQINKDTLENIMLDHFYL